jgi:hypothetical protein
VGAVGCCLHGVVVLEGWAGVCGGEVGTGSCRREEGRVGAERKKADGEWQAQEQGTGHNVAVKPAPAAAGGKREGEE